MKKIKEEIMLIIICLVVSFYNIFMALIQNTKNIISAIIYKVIPFFLGLGCLYVAGVLSGIIKSL
ncbi:MAG TPA: hypothetical protein VIK86_04770 [Candidatus Paceibacterota bacterium]